MQALEKCAQALRTVSTRDRACTRVCHQELSLLLRQTTCGSRKNEVKSSESGKRETAPAPVLNKGNLGDVCTFQFSAHLQILSLCEEHLQRQPQHSEGHSMMTAAAALT